MCVSSVCHLVRFVMADPNPFAPLKYYTQCANPTQQEELISEGCPESLIPHKVFPGNRPSLSLLFPQLTPQTVGQLLALYEHRVAVQGYVLCVQCVWNVCICVWNVCGMCVQTNANL